MTDGVVFDRADHIVSMFLVEARRLEAVSVHHGLAATPGHGLFRYWRSRWFRRTSLRLRAKPSNFQKRISLKAEIRDFLWRKGRICHRAT